MQNSETRTKVVNAAATVAHTLSLQPNNISVGGLPGTHTHPYTHTHTHFTYGCGEYIIAMSECKH